MYGCPHTLPRVLLLDLLDQEGLYLHHGHLAHLILRKKIISS
jgi:hypothetical protein